MNFFEIIKQSFEITWKNKKLWILGIFAAIAGGANLNFSNPFSGGNFYQFKDFNPGADYSSNGLQGLVAGAKDINYSQISNIFSQNYIWVIVFIAFLICLALTIFSIICKAGLINQIFLAADQKAVSTKAGIIAGYHRFWQFLAIMILISLGICVPLLIIIGVGVLTFVFKIYWVLAIVFLLFLVLIVWIIYLSILTNLAFRFCIDQNKGSFASINLANELLKNQFKNIMLFWLIELGLKIGVGIIFAFVILILFILGFIIGFLIYLTHIMPLFIIILTLLSLILILSMMLLNGVILTYFDSYWNLVYLEIKKKYVKE